MGAAARPWTDKQTAAHEAAEILRAAGVDEESEPIQALKALWWDEYTGQGTDTPEPVEGSETPLYALCGLSWTDYCTFCNTVDHEAGAGCTPEHQRDAAGALWNRVKSDRFPDTVVDVVCQPRQYSSRYVTDSLDGIDQSCIDAVDAVLSGEWVIPSDVVWQANFPQGSYTYAVHTVSLPGFHSVTYICGG